QNQGNIPLNIQFGGFSRSGSLDYRFSPGKVELEPGEVKRADLTVRPKGGRPLTGSQDIDFAVIARSLDPAAYQAPLPATYRMTASPATIAAGIGLPVLLGAGAVAFAVLLGLLLLLNILPNPLQTGVTATATRTLATQPVTEQVVPTDPPELATPVAVIDSFEVVPAQVTFRVVRDVILRWDVENIEEITLFSDDGEPLVLSDEDLAEGLVRVPSHILSPGDAVFRLRVVGTDGTPVIQEVTLPVQLQLCGLPDRAAIYELPLQTADRQQPVEGSVSIAGRSENMDWVYIRYGEEALNGWVEASNVNCPEGSQPLGDFVVIEAELPPGAEELPPDRGNTDR
ncbi:MAG: hypothetical protein ACFB51_03960, partial [Anaerolineae bacterium]